MSSNKYNLRIPYSLVILLSLCLFVPNIASAFTLTRTPNQMGLQSGLVGWWTFDGKDTVNGVSQDISGQANHGRLLNISTTTFYAMGKLGQAFRYDGVDDRVAVPQGAALSTIYNNGGGGMSISFWVKPDSLQTIDSIALGIGGDQEWAINFTNSNRINVTVTYDGAANLQVRYDNQLSPNSWNHILITWTGSTETASVSLYNNGVLQTQVSGTAGIGNPVDNATEDLYFGSTNGASSSFRGIFDDMRIYERVLTAGEALQLYNQGAAVKQNATPREPLKSGLVGHWTFDGKDVVNGSVKDHIGGAHATTSGIATTTFYTAGKIGQGFNFDGVNDYVSASNESTFDFAHTQPFSLAAWINPNPTFDNQEIDIITKADPSTFQGYAWYITDAGQITFFLQNNFSNTITTRTLTARQAPANQWTHLVATYDGSGTEAGLKLYVNGQTISMVPSAAGTVTDILTNENLLIGDDAETDTCCNFGGKIDDVRVYNRQLSATEVIQLYNQGGGAKQNATPREPLKSGLLAQWTFDGKDMPNGVARDVSGSGNTGNLLNISTTTFYAAGRLGQGLNFDGSNDVVDIGQSFADSINAATLTACAWFKPFVIDGAIMGNVRFYIVAAANGRIEVTSDNFSTAAAVSDTNVYTLGEWAHLCVVRLSSGTATIYVNGTISGAADQGNTIGASPFHFGIGQRAGDDNSFPFKGPIDDVRIYSRVLSATEIRQIYNLGR
jgi:hypothetical protein